MDDEDKAECDRIFGAFDANSDGKISATEFGEALTKLGSGSTTEVQTMMDALDTDGDGYICYEEFSSFYNANKSLMKDVAKILLV
ncbi:polcalcin Bra n 2-like [Bidens hawaiensis]|uniref:polcalcin Bra n 2-like n=1 Tax=Bidens hawaiensis TaxID=980011 RepID=UPI00404B1BDA